jgi:glycosyltransferase involved in cell wall biosynthesis
MLKEIFLISVIIPTYNRSKGLEYTLKSLANQSMEKSDFEVVVVDDGSSDDTFKIAKRYENVMNIAYGYQTNKGYRPSSARNIGIRLAKGKICLFIDSGIIAKHDCLQKHIEYHRKANKEIAVIGYTYGYTQHGETDDELLGMVDPNDADKSIKILLEKGKFLDVREKIYRKYNDDLSELTVNWTLFWGGHLSVPTKSLHLVDGFDENYDGNWGCEDNDLGYRLQQEHLDLAFCREVQVLHLPHGSNLDLKKLEGYENCKYFHNKFQTAETELFLSYYLKEITGQEVIDFHDLIISTGAKTTT